MENLENLKKEQSELKDRLMKVIDYINSEEFFTLNPREKALLVQQRSGMEIYLNALTNRIFSNKGLSFDISNTMWLSLLPSLFSTPWNTNALDKGDFSKESEEKQIYNIPQP